MKLLNIQTGSFSGFFNDALKRYGAVMYRKKKHWKTKSEDDKKCKVIHINNPFRATFKYQNKVDIHPKNAQDYKQFEYLGSKYDVIIKEGNNLYPLSGLVFEQLFYKKGGRIR